MRSLYGYGDTKDLRLKYGRTQGFEINAEGFSMAGPKYYARFRQVCLDMIDKYGVNCFKFDGFGVGNTMPGEAYRTPNAEQLADTAAMCITVVLRPWGTQTAMTMSMEIWSLNQKKHKHEAVP